MCLTLSKVPSCDRWNWDGDHIIHECIVPASRPVVGYAGKRAFYDIDVREFLVSERNEVMRKAIRKDIKEYIRAARGADWELFQSRRPGSFARAAHGVADFYAHSSYMHFAGDSVRPVPYDPAQFTLPVSYDRGSTFDLAGGKFSINAHIFKQTSQDAADHWRGKLISGRYAQPHDTQPGIPTHLTEGLTFIPKELLKAPDFKYRGGLPHHNEIAVDDVYAKRSKSHTLYGDAPSYTRQLEWRTKAAAAHIAAAFSAQSGRGAPA